MCSSPGYLAVASLSVLHTLEDLGYEVVDNPPLHLVETLVARSEHSLAIGIHARTRGFDAGAVVDMMGRLKEAGIRPELIYTWADESVLLRRYTELGAATHWLREGACRTGLLRRNG